VGERFHGIYTAERIQIEESLEMEFLNINVTEDSSLLLPCDSQSFYWRIFKENHADSTLVLKTHTKKSAKQEPSSPFKNSIL
jgi:hypothetical protein